MDTAEITITRRRLKILAKNGTKSAAAVNLVYVNDAQPGITRLKEGDGFVYYFGKRKITSKKELDRIKKLVIPPAWQNVWICPIENGHLQVTGIDALNRKQYKYHPLWNTLRNHTKFSQLHDFGKQLPQIRAQLQKDLQLPGLPLEKVLAAAISIMQCTCIRIGNNAYEKLYGSFGLTTLKDRHVKINGSEVCFGFKGKKGIYHNVSLKSKKLANIVKKCRDIPGKELFQYYTENGNRRTIDSGMVNNYIRQITGGDFTAKDFRTWAGSLQAIAAFKELGSSETVTETKRKIVAALDRVAKHLGNTRTVCKKYYVHPVIIDHYTNNTLDKYIKSVQGFSCANDVSLTDDETALMKLLETTKTVPII